MSQDNLPLSRRIPDRTRSLARWAMFFALLALAVSGFTLIATYQDGKILKNAREFTVEIEKLINRRGRNAEAARKSDARTVDWEKIDRKLDSVGKAVGKGDSQARLYMENLIQDLKTLGTYTSEQTSRVLDDTRAKLEPLREQIKENAPLVVDRLKALRDELAEKTRGLLARTSESKRETKSSPEGETGDPEEAGSKEDAGP